MIKILFFTAFFTSTFGHALTSEMIFTGPDLKANQLIQRAIGGDDNNLSVNAARVLQLQVNATGCNKALVTPDTMVAAVQYKFTVSADNCKVVRKSENCDSGFNPKDMQNNPNTPEYVIVGAEKYKVCVKDPSAPASSVSGDQKKVQVPTEPRKKTDEELLNYFRK